jgi:hypothetical protein
MEKFNMMIMLSPNDVRRLSPACRAELMALLTSPVADDLDTENRRPYGLYEESSSDESTAPIADEVLEEKRVVDLTVDEARDLLANISDRSQKTLKLFAPGKPLTLNSLIGPGGEYRDYSELKRSFVGAVNRRLRTVSGSRNAALFSSDRDKTRIKITRQTALALRCAFNFPESMPEFDFFDQTGKPIAADQEQCKKMHSHLAAAWPQFTGRPNDASATTWAAWVLQHFVDSGMDLLARVPGHRDGNNHDTNDTYQVVIQAHETISNAAQDGNAHNLFELFIGLAGDTQIMARPNL